MPPDSTRPPSSSFEGDFAPGEVLIGRYRIIALIGEGGMGQVYLADDLVLGQSVAVKFLPESIAEREGGLDRFRAEVRHARDVTHPNVARVHDIGEVDGRHFLTMEFVDGEDLASLIRRIGRLPKEKASQTAQQICSGLAQAHRKGVLHRDLKPANVMLDGEGHAKLTDFGLAIAVDSGDVALAGTPQYMAPEQLSGLAATERSDIYSLGLVLYELYTGARALRGRTVEDLRREHEEGPLDPPSTQLPDLDPKIDAILTRCLARNPEDRPRSVEEVARALPGGDPLAAALAAGETPSPEAVAAAGDQGAVSMRTGLALLLGTALTLLALLLLREVHAGTDTHYGKPPAVLRERARELVTELVGEVPQHEIHWYSWDQDLADARNEGAEGPAVHPLVHHSRFGPEPFVAAGYVVTSTDPAFSPGSAHVVLGVDGNLIHWGHRLPTAAATDGAATVDWGSLLERAGFEHELVQEVESRRVPPGFATERRAWLTADGWKIEASGVGALPVSFDLIHDGVRVGLFAPPFVSGPAPLFMLFMIAVGGVLGWRNTRLRRADVRGALCMGLFAFAVHLVYIFVLPLPDTAFALAARIVQSTPYAVQVGVFVAVYYLALEPFVRRRWPRALISWTRLLEGRFRDTSVGRELLIGVFAGPAVMSTSLAVRVALDAIGVDWGASEAGQATFGLKGPITALTHVLHSAGDAPMIAGILVLTLVVLRWVVRVPVVGNALWIVLAALLFASIWEPISAVLFATTALALLTRVGYLSLVANFFAVMVLSTLALTLRPNHWYFPSSLVALGALAFLAIWAFRSSVETASLPHAA